MSKYVFSPFVLIFCALFCVQTTTAQQIEFEPPVVITANFGARDLIVDHLNSDGVLDLITVGNSSDDIKVHLGQGSLTYGSPFSYGAADSPQRIASADFNNDGFPDVAITSSIDDLITVRINNQFGGYNSSATYAAGNTPMGITTDDYNGDGIVDLAVAIDLGDEKAVYLGNGDGTFQSAIISFGGDRPQGIRSADLNGDGFSDIVVSNKNDDEIGVFLGVGDGTFGNISSFNGGGLVPEFLELGDVNNDGFLDAVLSNFATDQISVLPGNGDGTFLAATSYSVADGPKGLTLVDLDQDGYLDVAVACENADMMSVLMSNGDGTFQTAVDFVAGNGSYHVKHADMNEDGVEDLLVVNRSSGGTVYIYLTVGCFTIDLSSTATTSIEGTDGTATVTVSANAPSYSVLWDDALGQTTDTATGLSAGVYTVTVDDGAGCLVSDSIEVTDPICDFDLSIAIVDLPAANTNNGSLTAVLEGGTGPFTFDWMGIDPGDEMDVSGLSTGEYTLTVTDGVGCPAQASTYLMEAFDFCDSTSILMRVEEVYFEDLNNDEVDDFIGVNPWSDNTVVLEGASDGTFSGTTTYLAGAYAQNATFADFNGDGAKDMIVSTPDLPDNGVAILFGNGDGTFQEAIQQFVGSRPWDVENQDLDNDGDIDLLVTRDQGDNVQVFTNNGTGSFSSGTVLSTGLMPKHMDKGDFNEDGIMDFVVSNSGGWDISIILGDGTSSPDLGDELTTTFHPYDVISADVNNDGHTDIITTNDENDRLAVFLGNGDATFQTQSLFNTPEQPLSLTSGDFNDDGFIDLATANRNGLSVSVYPGSGTGQFNVVQTWEMPRPLDITAKDFDNDGDDDLVIALDSFGAPYRVVFFENCKYNGCIGDFNGDGQINTADLIDLLSDFGCSIGCTADLNADGVVNTADLIAFLGLFGGGC